MSVIETRTRSYRAYWSRVFTLLLALSVCVGFAHHEILSNPWPKSNPLLVRAVGNAFNWQFTYAGNDRQFDTPDDILFDTKLYLPRGAHVQLDLSSEDLVYTFTNQELKIRELAVPDLQFSVKFQALKTGIFDLPSDPMCGMRFLHDSSMGKLIVQRRGAFTEWMNNMSPRSSNVLTTTK